MPTCLNCGHFVDRNFCPACGQKTSVRRLEMLTLVQDLPSVVFNLDRGFLYNLVQLTIRPGYAIKDYLDGKRKPFQNPLAYMLLVLAANLVANSLMEVHYYDPVQDSWMTPEQAARWKEYDASQQAWIHYYKFFVPIYLPWMALMYCAWLRVMRQRYTYAEGVCIAFFNSAQMTVPQIFVLILAFVVDRTAFTRVSDMAIDWPVIAVLGAFQYYQLANSALPRRWRIPLAVTGGVLLLGFSFLMINLFLAFTRAVGL